MPAKIEDLLTGHSFYAIVTQKRKKRVRGLKYLGQEPIYRTTDSPGVSIHRIPNIITQELLDKLSLLEYNGLYDVGPTKIPKFIEKI